eukprot:TRINITY_DN19204_c0_g1_i1.p1 TRINITY_DN19204_c0_g1~~TRINITY_DN19204_c0_g1_i1.p1  ORF type:complete len:147 (+),score=38.76 TRINITY_DN19204_c0_g1_i1:205-645(+)
MLRLVQAVAPAHRLVRHIRQITIGVTLEDDTVMQIQANPGETLLQALDDADMSDVWSGGACGGACSCSTCRVLIEEPWLSVLPEQQDDELDMLESAAAQEEEQEDFLQNARLCCQIKVSKEMGGMQVRVPDMGPNMLEVPLWMRNR